MGERSEYAPGVFCWVELTTSDEDKITVQRARKVERFLSQPFFVAEQFTGLSGKYVAVGDTVRSFKEIIEGQHDDIPERLFLMKGTIDEVVEEFRGASGSSSEAEEPSEDQGQDESESEKDEGGEE